MVCNEHYFVRAIGCPKKCPKMCPSFKSKYLNEYMTQKISFRIYAKLKRIVNWLSRKVLNFESINQDGDLLNKPHVRKT